MKAVILAAGMGTRLGTTMPKSLTPISGNLNILDFLLKRLEIITEKKDITAVVGYKSNLIENRYPDLNYTINNNYQNTNTAKSLLLAVQNLSEDVLWMNGDIYVDDGVIEKLLNIGVSTCLVNRQECRDEEIKYNTCNDGFIRELSKNITEAEGEALGINLILKKDLELFKRELKQVGDMDYFEKALENLTLRKKLKLKPIATAEFCCEMDFIKDVEKVQNYLKSRYNKRQNLYV